VWCAHSKNCVAALSQDSRPAASTAPAGRCSPASTRANPRRTASRVKLAVFLARKLTWPPVLWEIHAMRGASPDKSRLELLLRRIAANLMTARENARLTQGELAERCDMHPAELERLEGGTTLERIRAGPLPAPPLRHRGAGRDLRLGRPRPRQRLRRTRPALRPERRAAGALRRGAGLSGRNRPGRRRQPKVLYTDLVSPSKWIGAAVSSRGTPGGGGAGSIASGGSGIRKSPRR
jgi:hypothetical protein